MIKSDRNYKIIFLAILSTFCFCTAAFATAVEYDEVSGVQQNSVTLKDATGGTASAVLIKNAQANIGTGNTVSATKTGISVFGYNNTVMGKNSTAIGNNLAATMPQSLVMGHYAQALDSAGLGADYAIAIGTGRSTSPIGAVYTEASNMNSIAIGSSDGQTQNAANKKYTSASGAQSTAMGFNTTASKLYSTALGSLSAAANSYATAVGYKANASGQYSVSLSGVAEATNSVSIGYGASTSHENSVALGAGSVTSAQKEISVGNSTLQRKITNVATAGDISDSTNKYNALNANDLKTEVRLSADGKHVTAANTTAANIAALDSAIGDTSGFGSNNYAKNTTNLASNITALDSQAKINANNITAIQNSAAMTSGITAAKVAAYDGMSASISNKADKATTLSGYGITDAYTKGEIDTKVTALDARIDTISAKGTEAIASKRADASDKAAAASGAGAVASGYSANASGESSVATGYSSTASGKNAIAVGVGAKATGKDSIAIGTGHTVSGVGSGAIGDPSIITGSGSYAIGNNNEIAGDNNFVLGNGVKITDTNITNSVALGNKSVVTESNTVSVGSKGSERKIVNVANGEIAEGSTDAVTGGQLYTTNKAVTKLETGLTETNKTVATLQTGLAKTNNAVATLETKLTETNDTVANIETGLAKTDSTVADIQTELDNTKQTVADVQSGLTETNKTVANMQNSLAETGKEVKEVGAISAALAGLHYAEPSGDEGDKFTGAVAYGGYRGESAAALGIAYKPNANLMLSASTSVGNSQNAYNAGISYKFGKGNSAKTRAGLTKQLQHLSDKNRQQDETIAAQNAKIEELTKTVAELKKMIKK